MSAASDRYRSPVEFQPAIERFLAENQRQPQAFRLHTDPEKIIGDGA
jgi:hypothetical protein